jgi:hypothetical protein
MWSYVLADSSTANIRAIVQDNRVEDTGRIYAGALPPCLGL